jgi:hypothetical protein
VWKPNLKSKEDKARQETKRRELEAAEAIAKTARDEAKEALIAYEATRGPLKPTDTEEYTLWAAGLKIFSERHDAAKKAFDKAEAARKAHGKKKPK